LADEWRRSPWKRLQIAAIAALGYPLISLLGHTLRWRVEGLQHVESILATGRQPVMAFWHGRILPATFYFRRRGIVVMTSENFDGEWIGRIIERFGYGTARGSSSRGGRRALLQLVKDMQQGRAAGFAIDGPRGPRRVAQPGAVWLAGAAGQPLLPFHLEASRYWELRSWDRTQIPHPFSTVALVIGEPMPVAPDLTDMEREAGRVELETRLRALEQRALALVGR
jgi:lysophospholipid acyltransferase (LPLAT)-like uncharacterized protein